MTLTLFPQFGLSLLDGAKNHVARGGSGESVQAGTSAIGFDDEERLGTTVVCAVDDGTGGKTKGHTEFLAGGTNDCVSSIIIRIMCPFA